MIVSTIHGDMDDSLLEKREGADTSETEICNWTEYWLNGELVHRSVHLELFNGPTSMLEAAIMG